MTGASMTVASFFSDEERVTSSSGSTMSTVIVPSGLFGSLAADQRRGLCRDALREATATMALVEFGTRRAGIFATRGTIAWDEAVRTSRRMYPPVVTSLYALPFGCVVIDQDESQPASTAAVYGASEQALRAIGDAEQASTRRAHHLAALDNASLDYCDD